jgi:3-oxoacyl-[acyl-carrier protein] reductase
VNAVAPGWVATEGTLAGGRIQEAVRAVPLGRAAEPAEIADWVWKLASVPGSYLTGATLVISGGLVLR